MKPASPLDKKVVALTTPAKKGVPAKKIEKKM
jgi:hypothetical protein